jgi:hypothetical protein
MIDPHLAHWAGGGSVDRRLNTSSILEWRLWDISLSYSPGQKGNDQYCSLLCTEGLVLAPLFSRGRTSAKMPVQPTLLHVSCAPPATRSAGSAECLRAAVTPLEVMGSTRDVASPAISQFGPERLCSSTAHNQADSQRGCGTVHNTFHAFLLTELDRNVKTTAEMFEKINLRLGPSLRALQPLMATDCSFAESYGPHRAYPFIGKAYRYERTV